MRRSEALKPQGTLGVMEETDEIEISKELIEKVLKIEITTYEVNQETLKYNEHFVISLYKFEHLCKIYADDCGYQILSSCDGYSEINDRSGNTQDVFWRETEIESVIKSTEQVIKYGK